jgi:hypothetical protein
MTFHTGKSILIALALRARYVGHERGHSPKLTVARHDLKLAAERAGALRLKVHLVICRDRNGTVAFRFRSV